MGLFRRIIDYVFRPEIEALREEGVEFVRVSKHIQYTRHIGQTEEEGELGFPDEFARRVSKIYESAPLISANT